MNSNFTHQTEKNVKWAMFSQDESRILTWSKDGAARVWDSASGKPLTQPLEHETIVKEAEFNQDDSRILTWSDDTTLRVWDLQVDYDFPRKYLNLQLEVQTGTRLNEMGVLEVLSSKEWQEKKRQYEEIAREHARVCKYPEANLFLKKQ